MKRRRLEKTAFGLKGHSLGKDFVAGMDPFGVYTTQYGQQAQRRRESQGSHSLRRAVGTAGGVVGGAALVPSAIYGLVEGAKGLAGGRHGAIKGFARGFKEPIRAVLRGRKAVKGLERAAQATRTKDIRGVKLTGEEQRAMRGMVGEGVESAQKLFSDPRITAANLIPSRIRAGVAKRVLPVVKGKYREGQAILGLGGAVGGGGAFVQYGKGRESEKSFQARTRAMRKTASSLGDGFEESVYYLVPLHTNMFQALDKLAYHAGSDAPEDIRDEAHEEDEDRKKELVTHEKVEKARKLLKVRAKGKKKAIQTETGVEETSAAADPPEGAAEKVARLTRVAYLSR